MKNKNPQKQKEKRATLSYGNKHLREVLSDINENALKSLQNYIECLVNSFTIEFESYRNPRGYDIDYNIEFLEKIIDFITSKVDCVKVHELTFYIDNVVYYVCPHFIEQKQGKYPIRDLLSETTIEHIREMLLQEILALPRDYKVLIPLASVSLPNDKPRPKIGAYKDPIELFNKAREMELNKHNEPRPNYIKPLKVSANIQIFTFTDLLYSEYPAIPCMEYESKIDLEEEVPDTMPSIEETYISMVARGYTEPDLKSQPFVMLNTLRTLKQLIAALIVNQVLKTNGGTLYGSEEKYNYACVYPLNPVFYGEKNCFEAELPILEREFLKKLTLIDATCEPSQNEPTELDKKRREKGKHEDSLDRKHRKIQNRLDVIGKLFQERSMLDMDVEKEFERVKTSLEWFFDGYTNYNQTFSFIQFSIALEALLVDPKASKEDRKKDLSERLADRCAYLITDGVLERREIREKFVDAYKVRSDIVHEGKPELRENIIGHYETLKQYLMLALKKEIENLPEGTVKNLSHFS